MMNMYKKISIILTFMVALASCDYVSAPLKSSQPINNNTGNSNKVLKNVLIEDYTGSTCVNCPSAAAELDSLIAMYGSRIVPISVNAGSFAIPVPTYSLNLQSAVSDAYDGFFNMSNTGNPCGMINRKGTPLSAKYLLWGQWGAATQSIIQNDTAFVQLALTTTFDTTSRALNVSVNTTFLSALTGAYNLVVLFTQDSIIGPQKSITLGEIVNYAHRFVLRDNLSAIWGDVLASSGTNIGQVVTKTYSYNVGATYPAAGTTTNPGNQPAIACNFKKCSIVAFVYNATTSSPSQYEVLQSATKKIYP